MSIEDKAWEIYCSHPDYVAMSKRAFWEVIAAYEAARAPDHLAMRRCGKEDCACTHLIPNRKDFFHQSDEETWTLVQLATKVSKVFGISNGVEVGRVADILRLHVCPPDRESGDYGVKIRITHDGKEIGCYTLIEDLAKEILSGGDIQADIGGYDHTIPAFTRGMFYKSADQPVDCMQPSDYAESLRPILEFIQSIGNVAPYPYVNGTQLIVDSRVMAKTLELIVGSLFHARPFKRESSELAWVIEDANPDNKEPRYWFGWAFTESHSRAIRFCRKEDADRVAYTVLKGVPTRVAEHAWMSTKIEGEKS